MKLSYKKPAVEELGEHAEIVETTQAFTYEDAEADDVTRVRRELTTDEGFDVKCSISGKLDITDLDDVDIEHMINTLEDLGLSVDCKMRVKRF